MFCKKGAFRKFAKFTGKHLCQSFIFNKVAGLRLVTLLKKRLWRKCFLVNFVKFLTTPFYRTPPGNCFCISGSCIQETPMWSLRNNYRTIITINFVLRGDKYIVPMCRVFKPSCSQILIKCPGHLSFNFI